MYENCEICEKERKYTCKYLCFDSICLDCVWKIFEKSDQIVFDKEGNKEEI